MSPLKTKKATFSRSFLYFGSPTWTRTRDLRINSPSLYRLSYQGKEQAFYTTLLLFVKILLQRKHKNYSTFVIASTT